MENLFERAKMSDSGSELSTPANIPSDSEIEQCLRQVVRDALKAGKEVSVSQARVGAAQQLGLDSGFFKDDDAWKTKSKDIIHAAFDEPESPVKPRKSAPKPKAKPAAKAGTKRKLDEKQPKKKRQKKSATPESGEDVQSEEDETPKPKAKKGARSKAAVSESEGEPEGEPEIEKGDESKSEPEADREESSALSEPATEDNAEADAPKANGKSAEDDKSEMSDVIDEPLPKKKRQKKSTSPSDTKTKGKKTAKPAKAAKDLSPDDEEIKRLQGWLVKCGIRKIWGVELKKFDTAKEKIKHLKTLLEDVGMTGRYSTEKARQIKEQRELKAELEAAKEFNDQWGQKGSGDESGSGDEEKEEARPERLRPKGLVDFGDSGDED